MGVTEQTIPWKQDFLTNWKPLLFILLTAAFFRLYGAFEHQQFLPLTDEGLHIPNALNLLKNRTTVNFHWQHPPLSGLILQGTMLLFGDNPVGWRIPNIFFGTASVLLVWLCGRRLYPESTAPLLAAAILACDPFHIYLSRTTFVEIPVSFFFLLHLWLILEYTEADRPLLPLAGIAMGLTMATKAYYAPALPLTIAYALYRGRQRGMETPVLCLDLFASLLILPATVALLSYFQWFSRGYSLSEFITMKQDAVWVMQRFRTVEFPAFAQAALTAGGSPAVWFVKPITVGQQIASDGGTGRFLLEINNFPFRVLALPAVLLTAVAALRAKMIRHLLPPILFLACYALFLAVNRPMFSYSAAVILPFAWLCVGTAVVVVFQSTQVRRVAVMFVMTLALLWGCYTFPLVSGRAVPLSLYGPILKSAFLSPPP